MGKKIVQMLKAVLASYIITGLLLVVLTFLAYQFKIEEKMVGFGINITYVFSTFIGGFVLGKLVSKRRFLWGIFMGMLYIGLLYGISYVLYGGADLQSIETIKAVLWCIGGGMFGGMMS